MTQTIILHGPSQRDHAKRMIDVAPVNAVVKIGAPGRTLSQNDKMWAMLSDISRAKPEGRMHTPEVWKALFMHACGYAVQFEHGLDGQPFPVGFRSSRLTKEQMSDLIEFIAEYGSRYNIRWSEENAECHA